VTHAAEPAPADPLDLEDAWDRHGAEILGFATTSLGDPAAAEDCVQETFLRAWRARHRFSGERASARTWLFAIARNVVVDAHRARRRRPAPTPDDRLLRLVPSAEPEQARLVDQVTLVAAVTRLRPEHREVVVAVAWEGRSYDEVAAATGVPLGTLRSRMYYALRHLREILAEDVAAHDLIGGA